MEAENVRTLLMFSLQLRTHLSNLISSLINYVVIINVGLWSYFLKSYVDSVILGQSNNLYIGVACAISSVSFLLWRFYTHYLDNHIAQLYPEFILYERRLNASYNMGTTGYLKRQVKGIEDIITSFELNDEQKAEVIRHLAKSKRMGGRGHLACNVGVSIIILGMLGVVISFIDIYTSQPTYYYTFVGICLFSLCAVMLQMGFYNQKNPSKRHIERAKATVKEVEWKSYEELEDNKTVTKSYLGVSIALLAFALTSSNWQQIVNFVVCGFFVISFILILMNSRKLRFIVGRLIALKVNYLPIFLGLVSATIASFQSNVVWLGYTLFGLSYGYLIGNILFNLLQAPRHKGIRSS